MQGLFFGILAMTAGTVFLMWLGEQIDEYGMGNGISLIIMAGIVSRMPWAIMRFRDDLAAAESASHFKVVFLVLAFVSVVGGAIQITQGQRRIPIQQGKVMRGRRMYGGQRQYLPLRVNHGGVMPIIFASSFMMFPPIIIQVLQNLWPNSTLLISADASFNPGAFIYNIIFSRR